MSEEEQQEQEVVMSYETLYEFLRREKNREEIQKLPDNFLHEVNEYIEKLRQSIKSKKREVSAFEGDEIKKEENRLNNLVGLLKDLYQKREKKLINLALTKSRTGAKLADVAYLTDEEKEFYNDLVKIMDYYRDTILNKMIALQISGSEKPKLPENQNSQQKEQKSEEESKREENKDASNNLQQEIQNEQEEKRRVRFLHAVPKFLDNNTNVLGPFEEDDIANLPSSIADILIKKGRAEQIKKN